MVKIIKVIFFLKLVYLDPDPYNLIRIRIPDPGFFDTNLDLEPGKCYCFHGTGSATLLTFFMFQFDIFMVPVATLRL